MSPGMEWYLGGFPAMAAGALLWPRLAGRNAGLAGWLAAIVPALMCLWLLSQTGNVSAGRIPEWSAEWLPQMGVNLDFRLDGPGLLLSTLITGIGALVLIYGGAYLKGSAQAGPFFAFVQLFMLAMLGVAGSDNLLVLFVFWELTSLTSYLLIGLSHSDAAARKSALRALLVTGAGGLALLAGILLLGQAGGSFSIAQLQSQGEAIRQSPFYTPIFVLVALGAFTKSAQIPFHFWLPDAMAAPTPVSAYLHSATMVKAGVFLLAKFTPILGGTALWQDTLTLFGGLTMFLGAVMALAQTDIKRLLAYSTMSALGTLVMLLGIGTETAVKAAMVFLVVHALYKAPLFMIAGVMDKATGTRDVTLLHGLGKSLPLAALAAGLAALSMSGIPPFLGFIGKELLYEAETRADAHAILLTCLGFGASAINVTIALKVGFSPFRNRGAAPEIHPKARQWPLVAGPLLLAVAGLLAGLFPGALGQGLIHAAVRDITGTATDVDLKLWHGFNLLLVLSALTVAVGILLYLFRNRIRLLAEKLLKIVPVTASGAFDQALAGFLACSAKITRFFQHGNLRLYLAAMLLCLSALVTASLASTGLPGLPQSGPVRFVPVGVALLMVLSGVVALRSKTTVMAVLAMGGVGFGVALLFAMFGAPDLALTQILVETLTLVLFALVMRRLPPVRSHSSPRRRATDLGISLAAGIALTAALLAARGAPLPEDLRVSAEMATRSLPEAHGKNVVNVILVDFRAFDTLGEITVLSIAGIGAAGLMLGHRRRNIRAELAISTPLYRTSITWLMPLLMLMSIVLLFRGHNEPGGGFIGGLVAGVALVLHRLGTAEHPLHAGRTPLFLIASGLAVALASTLPSLAAGKTFMAGVWWSGSLWLPFVGKTKFGTPFLFDIGVFLVVTGVCLLILTRLARGENFKTLRDH